MEWILSVVFGVLVVAVAAGVIIRAEAAGPQEPGGRVRVHAELGYTAFSVVVAVALLHPVFEWTPAGVVFMTAYETAIGLCLLSAETKGVVAGAARPALQREQGGSRDGNQH